ncbi:MAG: ABC transporter permease [Halanaerobiales bacterium]|nr:ABC transporter permease [Halanaerobiales bacterium]
MYDENVETTKEIKSSPGTLVWRRFRHNRMALIGLGMLSIIVLISILAPLLATHDPNKIYMDKFRQPPNDEHILGTDSLGRDVWSRLVYGSRVSMTVGITAVAMYLLIGVTIGTLAAYFGGVVDMVLMRLTDIVMSFPFLLFALVIVATLEGEGNIWVVMGVIGLLGWTTNARLIRGQILSLRDKDYVQSARALGASHFRIIFKHLLPNAMAPVLVASTLSMAFAIMTEAALSFLGMGVPPTMASWGSMLSEANSRLVMDRMPWLWVPPGIAVLVSVLSINFVGDGLRDALDPKQKNNKEV